METPITPRSAKSLIITTALVSAFVSTFGLATWEMHRGMSSGYYGLGLTLEIAAEGALLATQRKGTSEGVDITDALAALVERNPNLPGISNRIEIDPEGRMRFAAVFGSEISVMPASQGREIDVVLSSMRRVTPVMCVEYLSSSLKGGRHIGVGTGASIEQARERAGESFRPILRQDAQKACSDTEAMVMRYRVGTVFAAR